MKLPRRLSEFERGLRQDGAVFTLRRVARTLLAPIVGDAIRDRQLMIQKDIARKCDSTVRYGLFRGLKLIADTHWGHLDKASMLLGLYEEEVLAALSAIPPRYTLFVDVGAADGYYAIGALISGKFARSICFEISEKGRSIIAESARINGVADRVEIHGIAGRGFHRVVPATELQRAAFLIDIEGAEFDLLDGEALGALRESVIIVELHDWVAEASQKIERLRKTATVTHRVTEFSTGARNPAAFAEVRAYNDTDRWLLVSERRPTLMSWMLLEPR
jgi:hypothetical protein